MKNGQKKNLNFFRLTRLTTMEIKSSKYSKKYYSARKGHILKQNTGIRKV